MKKILFAAFAALVALGGNAQVTVNLNNNVPGCVGSPVYGPEPSNPTLSLTGNTASGIPPGTTTYGGSPLSGSGYTAQLFFAAGSQTDPAVMVPAGSPTTFRTGSLAGYLVATAVVVPLPAGSAATLQLRAWENPTNAYPNWGAAQAAWQAGLIAIGMSPPLFISNLAANNNLCGLLSFNLYRAPSPPAATLLVSPINLLAHCIQGENAVSQSFALWNGGTGTMSYTVSESLSWLSCAPTSGTSTGEVDTIAVDYSTTGLMAGTYDGTIAVSAEGASGSPQMVTVTMTVLPPPLLAVSPAVLTRACTAGENAASQSFEVWNGGNGTVDYTVSESLDWLSCTPTNGTSTGEHDAVLVKYNTAHLSPGTYNGTITVTASGVSGSPQTLAVTLIVEPSYRFRVSAGPPQIVGYGQEVNLHGTITNTSGNPLGELSYSWEQVPEPGRSTLGTAVGLSGLSSPDASFSAPYQEIILCFRLTVTDTNGYAASDNVRITVTEEADSAICVSATNGNDVNGGGTNAPVRTLARAISIANAIVDSQYSPVVWVEAGSYTNTTTLSLTNPVRMYGGFTFDGTNSWRRDASVPTRITGPATAISVDAPEGLEPDENVDSVIIDGFEIHSANGADGTVNGGDGEDSVCIYVKRGRLVAASNVLKPGTGGSGLNGAPGLPGESGQPGTPAVQGQVRGDFDGLFGSPGFGAGGTKYGGNGGLGGGYLPLLQWWTKALQFDSAWDFFRSGFKLADEAVSYGLPGLDGYQGAGQSQGGRGGSAPPHTESNDCTYYLRVLVKIIGRAGDYDADQVPNHTAVATSGQPGTGGCAAQQGQPGGDGDDGLGGNGGGGGGSHYLTDIRFFCQVPWIEAGVGGPGGGGGGGGEGGGGGHGGFAGGSSVGILVERHSHVRIVDNLFYLNAGGRGGDGGSPGAGGSGGCKGTGARPTALPIPWLSGFGWGGRGGNGQNGQAGGNGGRGGGGGGGDSFGVRDLNLGFLDLHAVEANDYIVIGDAGVGGQGEGQNGNGEQGRQQDWRMNQGLAPRSEVKEFAEDLPRDESAAERLNIGPDMVVLSVRTEWDGGDVTARVRTPFGQTITPDDVSRAPGMIAHEFRLYEHDYGDPAGEWTLVLERQDSPAGASDLVIITVGTFRNLKPVAVVSNITLTAGADGLAEGLVDAGSYDPDADDLIQVRQIPAGPYSVGTTAVTLEVKDQFGFVSTQQAMVTVRDETPPRVNVPELITVLADANGLGRASIQVHAVDNADPNPSIQVNELETYPVGATDVLVQVRDASGNVTEKQVKVVVIAEPRPVRPLASAYGFEEGTLAPFVPQGGAWAVLAGRLAQLNPSGLALARLDFGRFQEYRISFEFIQTEGEYTTVCYARSDQGVNYRVDFGTNYCRLTMPGDGQSWETRSFTVGGLDLALGKTNWVMVDVSGAGVRVYLEDELVHDQPWANGVPLGDGMLALGTYNAAASFDNVMVATALELRPLLRLALDDGTVNDFSGNGNHGTLQGTATIVDDPVRGKVLSLDGLGKVDLGNPAGLDLSGELTVAAWVKIGALGDYRNILARGAGGSPNREFVLRTDAEGNYDVGTWETNRGDQHATSSVPAEDIGQGNWVHLAGTCAFDGTNYTWRFYRNGLLAATGGPFADGLLPMTVGWAVGARGGVAGIERGFVGLVDDVRIYPMALRNMEIQAVMGVPPPSLAMDPMILNPTCYEGTNAASDSFELWNFGGASFSYTITESLSWLSCTPTSGMNTGGVDTIVVDYNTAGLAAGTYSGTITVTATGAIGSPKEVPVALTVLPLVPPDIGVAEGGTNLLDGVSTVSFGACQFGQTSPTRTFVVTNGGPGNLTLSSVSVVGSAAGDFLLDTTGLSATVGPGGTTTFTVAFRPAADGNRNATLQITSNDIHDSPFDIALSGTGTRVDSSFNPTADSWVWTLALQSDRKILLGGAFNSVCDITRNYLARLNADGSLDPGFDPNLEYWLYGATVQPGGRILLGGWFENVGGTPRNHIARLNADGTLDTGFNPDANSYVLGTLLQADGRILLWGGFTSVAGTTRNGIARLNADGSLDTSFDPNANDAILCVALQADGKILLGGYFTAVCGTARFRIARLHADGSVDSTFNPDANDSVNCLAVQPNGSIILGGAFTSFCGSPRDYLARLSSDGTLDTGFNPDSSADVLSVAMQADGRILVGGGFTTMGGEVRNRIGRLNPDGSLDAGFNPSASSGVYGVALQEDGKVLMVGTFTNVGGAVRHRIARLVNEPATQSIDVPDLTQLRWLRGGTAPEVEQVTFELSADGGSTWTALGDGERIPGGWGKTGLSLPTSGFIRAQGCARAGLYSGSSSLIQQVAGYSVPVIPLEIVTQPTHQTVLAGQSATFSVVATGTEPLSYQWRFNGAAISGATTPNCTVVSAGAYSVVVTNVAGSVTSAVATLTVQPLDTAYVTARPQPSGSGPNPDGTYAEVSIALSDSSAVGSAPGRPPVSGSRAYISSTPLTSTAAGVDLTPALALPGAAYLIDYNFSSTAGNASTNVMLSAAAVSGALSFSTTPAFQRQYGNPANLWQFMGYFTNGSGVPSPKVSLRYASGFVGSGSRLIFDTWRFTELTPCMGTPAVAVTGPLAANSTEVVVAGVSGDATQINVYQDSGMGMIKVAEKNTGLSAGVNTVTVSGLLKGAQVAATQVIGGQEGCIPTVGTRVGGGANPAVRIAFSIREDTTLTGPIGAYAAGTANIYFLGASNVLAGSCPAEGIVLNPSTNWQTVTLTRGPNPQSPLDPVVRWNNAGGDAWLDGGFGVFEGVAIANVDPNDNGPFDLYLDNLRNGATLIQDWESAVNGQANYGFVWPGFSGTTSGHLLSAPDESVTSAGISDTGQNSCRVRWQFLDGQTNRWLRLVTVGASGTPSPQVDLNQPVSLRILLPPPGWSPPARAPILSLPSWQAGQFQFTLTGTPGSNYIIQVATNLTGSPWIPIRTNVAPFLFTDPNASNHHQRLYRAVTP